LGLSFAVVFQFQGREIGVGDHRRKAQVEYRGDSGSRATILSGFVSSTGLALKVRNKELTSGNRFLQFLLLFGLFNPLRTDDANLLKLELRSSTSVSAGFSTPPMAGSAV
jgi:hypothetical protein